MDASVDDHRVEFLIRFARAGHAAGYPTADLEQRLLALADRFGLEGAQVSATPTIIDVSFGAIAQQRSYTLRVRPPGVDLDAISRLDRLMQEVLDRRLDSEAGLAALEVVETQPLERAWPIVLGAYSLAGASITPVLGGGWRDAIAGAVVGLLVGAVAFGARRVMHNEAMVAPLAAVTAGFSAQTLGAVGLHTAPDVVALAAIVTFLPGMTLTIGVRELATEHLQSGVANTANALVQLLGLVFGVGVGRSVAQNWFGPVSQPALHAGFRWTHLLGALMAGLAFTVTLRASVRSAPVMCSATILALVANAAGRAVFGATAGVFIAALTVGIVGGLLGALTRRSSLVFIVPGVLMLVPGSAGFHSLLQLLTGQTVSGIAAGFDTLVTALSIAYGLMLSAVILPRRLTRLAPPPPQEQVSAGSQTRRRN